MILTLLGGFLLIGLMISISPAGCSAPIQVIFGTATPIGFGPHTPTPTGTFTQTPTPTATETYTPVPTSTATWTPSPTPSATPSPSPSPTATATATHTATPTATPTKAAPPPATSTPSPSPTPSPTPTPPVPAAPVLLEPQAGAKYPNPILFRWDGPLNEGEAFQVTVWHTKNGERIQTSTMTEQEWTYSLPKDLIGEWRWVVWVIQAGDVVAESEEWFFWLDPHQGPGPGGWPTRQLPSDTPAPKPTPGT